MTVSKAGPQIKSQPEYIDMAGTRNKALAGNLTSKHVAGSLGGTAATIAVPNTMQLMGWGDGMGSGAVAIGGGIAVKQMDEGAGDTFMFDRLDMILREISPGRPGKIQKDIIVPKSIFDKRDFYKKTSIRK